MSSETELLAHIAQLNLDHQSTLDRNADLEALF